MNLPFDIAMPPIEKIITCTIEGILEVEDLITLAQAPEPTNVPQGASAGDLRHIKEKHHALARSVASGMTQRLAASICGMTEQYVSVLLNSPAMQELVQYYRILHGNASDVVVQRLQNLALGASEVLAERLENDSDELSAQDLIGMAKLGFDRSGHGPQSKQHVVTETHVIDHAELQRINKAARRESAEHIIEAAFCLPAPDESSDK